MPISFPPVFDLALEGDLTGTAFTAAKTYTVYTSYVLNDGQVDITWGRQDQRGEVTPAVFSFLLNNSDGRFTTGASIVHTGAWFRFRVTVNATTYERVEGVVHSVETTWRGGVQGFAVLRVNCVDVSGPLGTGQPLRSMLEQEMLADSPAYLYALGEAAGATSAGDSSSYGRSPATIVNSKYGTWPLSFGADSGMFDGQTGVSFGEYNSTTAASVLSIPFDTPVMDYNEVWFVAPDAAPAARVILRQWANYSQSVQATLSIETTGKLRWYLLDVEGDTHTLLTAASVCDGRLHQAVAAVSGNFTQLWFDGAEVDLFVDASNYFIADYVTRNEIGGSTAAVSGNTYPGVILFVAAFSSLTLARIQAHYAAGIGTGPQERSDQRFTRLLGYAGLTTTGLPTGIATMGGQRTAGKTVTQALAQVADTEGSVSFVKPNGKLTFQARNHRYWPTSAFTLSAGSAATVALDLTVREDKLGLVNDQAVTRDGGATQRVIDQTSIDDNGRQDGGSLDVAPSTDYDALQNASWRVATGKDPQTRLSVVTVNLRVVSDALAQSLLAATVSTPFTLADMPSQTPGGATLRMFIEGGHETWAVERADLEFFTSPLSGSGVSFTSGTSTPTLPNTLRASATADERTALDAGLLIPF